MEYDETMKIDPREVFLLLWKGVHYVLNQIYSRYSIFQFCSTLKECLLIINFILFYEVKIKCMFLSSLPSLQTPTPPG